MTTSTTRQTIVKTYFLQLLLAVKFVQDLSFLLFHRHHSQITLLRTYMKWLLKWCRLSSLCEQKMTSWWNFSALLSLCVFHLTWLLLLYTNTWLSVYCIHRLLYPLHSWHCYVFLIQGQHEVPGMCPIICPSKKVLKSCYSVKLK
jgi:hypothetical protein